MLVVESEWYRLGTRYYEKLPERIGDIIREDIQFVAGENLAPARARENLTTSTDPRR